MTEATGSATRRVLVVARLFSGLADSLETERWSPAGVPAFYKMLEALEDQPSFDHLTIFTSHDPAITRRFVGRRRVTIDRFRRPLMVISWQPKPVLKRLGVEGPLREAWYGLQILMAWARFRPHIAYFTKAHVATAALFARLRLCRTVLRIMGLFPEEHRLAARGGMQRWLFRSPFNAVIATEEGSGNEYYLPLLLSPTTPRFAILNGVDIPPVAAATIGRLRRDHALENRIVVLFVGRLEPEKGCQEFVDAALRLLSHRPNAAAFVIIGHGKLYNKLANTINSRSCERSIILLGQLPHSEIAAWLATADIYVSLNRNGNLSNANLEALASGRCCLFLARDPARHIDETTEKLIPAHIVPRIQRQDTAAALAAKLDELIAAPERISAYAEAVHRVADELLARWSVRMEQEISILTGKNSVPTVIAQAQEEEQIS